MVMSNEDIVRDYNSARNRLKQINILADLNECKPKDIVKILHDGGCELVGVYAKRMAAQEEQKPEKLTTANTRAAILQRAAECVCGQREQDYGSPEQNFQKIAVLWTAYYGSRNDGFNPVDVAMMMALLKIARITAGGTEDSFVDLAGYAACGAEIAAGLAE